jgi:hypothetical protein
MSWRTWRADSRNGLGLDVADGSTDFGDDDVGDLLQGHRLGRQAHAPLDLVGDVRDDLNGVAEVLAAALPWR